MMTDQELEQLIFCRVEGEPDEADLQQWARQSGESVERMRAIYQSVCDRRRSQDAQERQSESDPSGDY